MKQGFTLFLLLFVAKLGCAQVSFNLKLKANQPELKAAFYAAEQSPARLQNYPALALVTRVKPMVPQGVTNAPNALSDWFNLVTNTNETFKTLNVLQASGLFEVVEVNHKRKLDMAAPNDTGVVHQDYHKRIKTFEGWDYTKGDPNVIIGFIDTGIDYRHAEFFGQLKVHSAEDLNGNNRPDSTDFNGIDDDQNGYVDDVIGYDFVDQTVLLGGGDFFTEDPDPLDDNQHGTLVAGIMGAKEENTTGGTGIAPGCRMLAIRAFSGFGVGEDDDISRGIVYAVLSGCKVINLSFGDIYPSQMMHAAIQFAASRNVCVVASAGNGTGDNIHYPSDFDEVISVSASDYSPVTQNEFLWTLSSYGSTVSLCAPGAGIYAPDLTDSAGKPMFNRFSGTSCSAPMVSAAAALILSQYGEYTPQQIRGILTSTADDLSPDGWDHQTGAGRLNIANALNHAVGTNIQITSPTVDQCFRDSIISVVGTVLHDYFVSYQLFYKTGDEDAGEWTAISPEITDQVYNDTLAVWNIANLPDTLYTIRLKVNLSCCAKTVEDRKRVCIDRTAPEITVKLNAPIWEDNVRKHFVIAKSGDIGQFVLYYRLKNSGLTFTPLGSDKITRTGQFLFKPERGGVYEFFVEQRNAAGSFNRTDTIDFQFQPETIDQFNVLETPLKIPNGGFLPQTYDFNQNQRAEIVMSRFNASLGFGKTEFWEYNAGKFDSLGAIQIPDVLLPKDVADFDGDGKLDLLGNNVDSQYLFGQNDQNGLPDFSKLNRPASGLVPAQFADANQNGKIEIISRDGDENYAIDEWNGSTFANIAKLQNPVSPENGLGAPKVLVHDFDGDGKTEVVVGNIDGSLKIYEHNGAGAFDSVFAHADGLLEAGNYLLKGDFNGNGRTEIFVATHSRTIRNQQTFEYDPLYWRLQIFESNGNNQYQPIWEDYLFNINETNFSFSFADNLDDDAAPEILMTNYPRTYLIDHANGAYYMRWFLFGATGVNSVAHDFNQNGVKEFAVSLGDTAIFFEAKKNYQRPPHFELNYFVSNDSTVRLVYNAVSGSNVYAVFGAPILGDSFPKTLDFIGQTTATAFNASGLPPNQSFVFIVTANNGQTELAASNPIIAVPHTRNRLIAAEATGANQVLLAFSNPMTEREADVSLVHLNNTQSLRQITRAADRQLLFTFQENVIVGLNEIRLDTTFLDAQRAFLNPDFASLTFNFAVDTTAYLFLSRWRKVNDKEALLYFNRPLDFSSVTLEKFSLSPVGSIENVAQGDMPNAVSVSIRDARFGALGYPLTVRVAGVKGAAGEQMRSKEGDAATFSEAKESMSEVLVYPNPVRRNAAVDGCRFANLPPVASVTIYNAQGWLVKTFEEQNCDGGLTWNLRDQTGERVRPGVFIFYATDPDGREFVGKFAVVE